MALVRADFVSIPLGPQPGFDHADVYRAGRRMYVADLLCSSDRGAGRDSGHILASLALPAVPGVVVYDPEDRRLYVPIGEPGLVCSFDSERLEQLETVETEQGAHTTCWDPISRCLYVFCPTSGEAAVYEEYT